MDRFVAQFRSSTAESGRVSGHAAIFGQVGQTSQGLERIDPAAFTRALAEEHDVSLYVNHNHGGLPLARTKSGTLRLGVDAKGLTIDADLADTSLGRDIRTLMARGDADRMSFGFVPKGHRVDQVEGRHVRTVTDLDLFDVSILAGPAPAYEGTDVSLRSMDCLPPIEPTPDPEPADPAPRLPVRLIRAKARLTMGHKA